MELYRRYGPALRRKCERILGDTATAEDVVQGVFVDLLRRGRTDVELAYLYRAATTRCLNRIRDRARRQDLLAQHGGDMLAPGARDLEARVLSADLLGRLVATLDTRSSEILVYHYLDGMTQDEVASILSVSRKTVGKRLVKIRAAIATLEGA